MGDVNSILASPTGFPFIQIFYNTTNSYTAANTMTAILIVTLTASTITEVATASRQLWSFARDGGLPFSSFFSYVRSLRRHTWMLLHWVRHEELTWWIRIGHTGMAHPSKLSDGLSCSDYSPLFDQHRLHCCSSGHSVSYNYFFDVCLYTFYWMRRSSTNPRRAASSPEMVSRLFRYGHQYCIFAISIPDLRLFFFSPHCICW